MAYLGTKPQSGFISQEANQYFTGLTQNYIDLNQSISSLSSVIVLVNGVVQENSTMSLTSSTRITLGATLVSADKVTCIYVAKISSTQAPATGTVTNDMLAGSIANSKLANSSITLNGSAVSLGGSATVGGTNTPSFMVAKTSAQSISNNTAVKITWQTELVDSDNAFVSEKFVVPSGKQGTYLIFATLEMDSKNNSDLKNCYVKLYKNGSLLQQHVYDFRSNQPRRMAIDIIGVHTLSASDYLEMYAQIDSDDGDIEVDGASSSDGYLSTFGGFKLL